MFTIQCTNDDGGRVVAMAMLPPPTSSSVSFSYLNLAVLMRICSLVQEFPIFYSHIEWNLLSSLYYNSENILDLECY